MTREQQKARCSRRLWLGGALTLSSLGFSGGCVPYVPSTAEYPADWNHRGVEWRPYALGLRDAARAKRPIVLVFYTDWCPHCHNYSRVFHDPRLVEASKEFVMIRVERDGNPELSAEYDLDGDYIPRTFFLYPNAEIMKQLNTGRSKYAYFLDEYEPDELLELMEQARNLARARPAAD